MRLSYFFSKEECIVAILEGLIFKIFQSFSPNHGGASLVTEPQLPQSQKCGYSPAYFISVSVAVSRRLNTASKKKITLRDFPYIFSSKDC